MRQSWPKCARWQPLGGVTAADPCGPAVESEDAEVSEEEELSERTVRRNEIHNKMAGLELDKECMEGMVQNTTIAGLINHYDEMIKELKQKLKDLESEEQYDHEESETSNASGILWEEVYDTTRKGEKMWLQTYVGGPAGGYVLDMEAERVIRNREERERARESERRRQDKCD